LFEVRMSVPEVAEERRHAQDALARDSIAFADLGADKASFDSTRRRAPVPILGVAVIAFLVDQQAVAALGGAPPSAARRFRLTRCRAAIEGLLIAVVAGLRSFLEPITADRRRAHARSALTLEPRLELTTRGAAVAGLRAAVVALL
jgi:hypothetical protein